ncbi:MAG: sensor domain-containing diguanylate cyclase [Acidimicrobiia bacterium]
MSIKYDALATAEDCANAEELTRRGIKGAVPALAVIMAIASLGGGAIASAALPDAGVPVLALATGVAGTLVGLPMLAVVAIVTRRRGNLMSVETVVRERVMETDARRREFSSRLARALEMADDEVAAFDVIDRAMRDVVGERPIELLLADNSHAHLDRVVVSSHEDAPGCGVSSPDECVAARRAQTQVFSDSEDLDACPLLRGRDRGRCSGVCIPVSIMGRTVGVMHTVGPVDEPLAEQEVAALQSVANQSGNRLGMLRVMAETQVQASTDGLTGLINRRSLENRVRQLRAARTDVAFVMADLDHFKTLNDARGHEAGDRALRVFAETLRTELRGEDLACRYGGEEFAIVLPGLDVPEAVEVVERVRDALAKSTGGGGAASFTCSFGIAHSADASDFEDLVQRADKALFAAKNAGRDRICLDGHSAPIAPTLTALA